MTNSTSRPAKTRRFQNKSVSPLLAAIFAAVLAGRPPQATAEQPADLQQTLTGSVVPFLQTYCAECHQGVDSPGKLDLTSYRTISSVEGDHQQWSKIVARLEANQMPPADASQHPSATDRERILKWAREVRRQYAEREAGDPGSILVRRLNNAEFNYTVRDLTGVDIQPASTFPVDPANEAGFDNTGESLTMSPALLKKYLEAARHVISHLVLQPEGFTFAPHPVATDTDRDKFCVKRIVEFYQRQPTDLADYFFAAWEHRQRSGTAQGSMTIAETAKTHGLSAKYLARVWESLTETENRLGPLGELRSRWQQLSADAQQVDAARAECEQLRDWLVDVRQRVEPAFENLEVEGSHKGSQPFVLWKNDQYAAYRLRCDPLLFDESHNRSLPNRPACLELPEEPADRGRFRADTERFCATFPNQFYVSERGRDYVGKPRDQQEKGRLLSAGFHSMMGYYRDDTPLCELVLDDDQKRELDRLWRELDFITLAPVRQYTGFVWFERTDSRYMRDPQFDFARAEDKDVTSPEKMRRLADVYLEKARRLGGSDVALQAIVDYFEEMNETIRWIERAHREAEPSHLRAMLAFAARAYRRPLAASESDELKHFYRSLRKEGAAHDEALQDTLVSILLSPHFCYRTDLLARGAEKRPLNDFELASRLSYFLWASMPDAELLETAARGELHRPDILLEQTKRMLQDPRIRGLAVEFAGNWLDFRQFETHNSVDRGRFPEFTDELRQAMFEEPIRFFVDLLQHDRSILEFLSADYTFVNAPLARHYGIPAVAAEQGWQRVDKASEYQRGGLLPMSVFLTKNAPGLRTSPVKRGYWVARRVLGETIPPPPPDVPELPADESLLGELSLREMLARHRDHTSCAGCHVRFDSLGLALEGFGPVGEARTVDLGGRPVEVAAEFPAPRAVPQSRPGNASEELTGSGLAGLRAYLLAHRREEFVDNLCQKLLSYALGRSLLPSDDRLLADMQQRLRAEDYRFASLVETIVTSRQFLHKRGVSQPASSSQPERSNP